MAFIYKIRNNITGKEYVGKTNRTNMEDRFTEHISNGRKINGSSKISESLRLYGSLNHTIEILDECEEATVLQREQYWIEKLNTLYFGYNIKNEYVENKESKYYNGQKQKSQENLKNGLPWNKGLNMSDDVRLAVSSTLKKKHELGLYGNYGHKHTEETKKKLSEIATRRPSPSLDTRNKLKLTSSGRICYYNPKEKKRIFIKFNEKIPDGFLKGKGTCWVKKNNTVLSVNIWDKQMYIDDGYSEGR
jgi:group I intron endonuclease